MRSARQQIDTLKRRATWLKENTPPNNHRAKAEQAAIEWAILNTEHIAEREEKLERQHSGEDKKIIVRVTKNNRLIETTGGDK